MAPKGIKYNRDVLRDVGRRSVAQALERLGYVLAGAHRVSLWRPAATRKAPGSDAPKAPNATAQRAALRRTTWPKRPALSRLPEACSSQIRQIACSRIDVSEGNS